MKNYEPGTPRGAFGAVAVIVTAITLGLFVALPAQLGMDALDSAVAVVQNVSS